MWSTKLKDTRANHCFAQIVNAKGEMKGSAITGPVGKEAAELWPVSLSLQVQPRDSRLPYAAYRQQFGGGDVKNSNNRIMALAQRLVARTQSNCRTDLCPVPIFEWIKAFSFTYYFILMLINTLHRPQPKSQYQHHVRE